MGTTTNPVIITTAATWGREIGGGRRLDPRVKKGIVKRKKKQNYIGLEMHNRYGPVPPYSKSNPF